MDKKSKPVTTSVPSISIKFHAEAQKIEELYSNDETIPNTSIEKSDLSSNTILIGGNPDNKPGEPEHSPLKYLPRVVKRSTSIDVSTTTLESSPSSDPWRFFSDIKGKITKSVEEKITEIKARNHEEGSPLHKPKPDQKTVKDSKEGSSVSDSEDLSESSISKTCGASTTEGAEMSSDEDTPSLDQDKKEDKKALSSSVTSPSLKQRFCLLRNKASPKEGTVRIENLSKLYNINIEKIDQALPEDSDDVESAVDALDEANFKNNAEHNKLNIENVLKAVTGKINNIELDKEDVLTISDVAGSEVRDSFYSKDEKAYTVFAPSGFVDLRPRNIVKDQDHYLSWIMLCISIVVYLIIHRFSSYLGGFVTGLIFAFILFKLYLKLYNTTNIPAVVHKPHTPVVTIPSTQIREIQAIKEYQPLAKYEGWINEYPDVYDPNTYHICHTQSVYIRLQGNLLRLSHSKTKVPKRAMWNEPEIKAKFTHHRIYNILDAKISLLPEGLAKKRLWSKKYPICITLNREQMNFVPSVLKYAAGDDKEEKTKDKEPLTPKRNFLFKKRDYTTMAQRFSKLTQDEDFDFNSDSRASTPSPDISDVLPEDLMQSDTVGSVTQQNQDDENNFFPDDWSVYSQSFDVSIKPVGSLTRTLTQHKNIVESPTDRKIYIFGRTDREKEDWFRRLAAATHRSGVSLSKNSDENESEILHDSELIDVEYRKYMAIFHKTPKFQPKRDKNEKSETDQPEEQEDKRYDPTLWLNSLIGRVLFDCMRDPNFTIKVKDRIQRKLAAIKLPYFIEEILITELSLGKTPPFIVKTSTPVIDDRGLWVDLDMTYEGLVILTLQTKLNLMRLKNPHAHEKPMEQLKAAIYNSDVDDSAESSSDEEPHEFQNLSQEGVVPSGGSSNSSKKFMKMVDKIAESKLFQAATENRYIKKAMEGVSNTDLRLTVEVKAITGTVVLNIPPPPSDRLWIGFRPVPEIVLSARPIVGERNISSFMVTGWIEKKLLQEFQKILVLPNMEDFMIPVMNPKLPE